MLSHWIAFVCFALTLLFHGAAIRRNRYLSRWFSMPLMLAGFVSLTAFLGERGRDMGACPIGNPFEILTLIVWTSVFFHLLVSAFRSLNYLGFFVSGFACLLLLPGYLFPFLDYAYDPAVHNHHHVVAMHASLAVFSYGLFLVLTLFSVMYLVQFYGLLRRRAAGFFSLLPSLMRLDRWMFYTLLASVFIFSVALFIGSFSWFSELGEVPKGKLVVTLLVWAFYALILFLRMRHRLVGARLSQALILAFLFALVALAPIDHARRDLPLQREISTP
jgi:ABC-type uncharacterized transport system permease subunit